MASTQPTQWLIDVLRGGRSDVVVTRRQPPEGHVEIERYTVFPTESDPKLLISASSSRVRAAALGRVGTHSSTTTRLIRRIGAELAKTGLDQLASPPDVVLSVEARAVADAPGDRAPLTLVEYLERALDHPGLHIAVTMGPLRPNRKPVVQVMDTDGHLVAYAKVGWDDSTRAMVAREAEVLGELLDGGLKDVLTPSVLHDGTWQDLRILVTAPLDDDDAGVPGEHQVRIGMTEVAKHRGVHHSTLRDSAWMAEICARADACGPDGATAAATIGQVLDTHGDVNVGFGFSHGDWAPWNMARLGRVLGVWDWERAVDGAPLGIDLVHWHFQQAFHHEGRRVDAALEKIRPHLGIGLARLGISRTQVPVLTTLYLCELLLRYTESGLSDDSSLRTTRSDIEAAIGHLTSNTAPAAPTPTDDAGTKGKRTVFTRRMLGGPGVPAPARIAAKKAVKTYGRVTSTHRTVPNTFIIGGQRCGTTSLFRYLTQHPSVTGPMLEKGVHYFDTNFHRDLDWYRSHFPTTRAARLSRQRNGCDLRILEACPYYSFHPHVPERIAEVSPDAKILMLVRDPVARALSHHNHEVKRGFETEDFATALDLEKERLDGEVDKLAMDPTYVSYAHQHHSYIARGHYEEQIARYDALFGAENVLVIRTTDLEVDPAATVAATLAFLEVNLSCDIEFPRFNARSYEAMDPDIERQLREEFAPTDAAMAARFGLDDPWV